MLLATTLPGCRAPGPFKGSFVLGDSVRMLKPIVLDVIPIHFVDAILQLIVVDGRSLKTYPAQHVLDVSELFCCCARLLCNVRVLACFCTEANKSTQVRWSHSNLSPATRRLTVLS